MPTLKFSPQKSLIPHLYFSNSSIQHNSHTPIKLGGSPSVSSLCFRSLSPSISLFVCFSLLHSQRFISYWRITWYDLKPLLLDIYFIVFFANFVMGEAKVRIIGLKKVCISNKMIKQCWIIIGVRLNMEITASIIFGCMCKIVYNNLCNKHCSLWYMPWNKVVLYMSWNNSL